MSGLLSKEMLGDLVINIANIVILFLVTKALVYKPVKKYLDARKENLAAAADEAEAQRKQAEAKQAEYEALLSDVENEKARLLTQAETDARAHAAQIVADAKKDAEETMREAEAKAQAEKEQAVADARDEIADLAFALSEKIMGRTATDADARRVAESFFEGAER